MRRLFLIFIFIIQSFFLYAHAGDLNCSTQKLNKNIEYISAQKTPTKKISIDFKNYENAIITTNSKSQEIFASKNSNNIDGFFLGFLNCDLKCNFGQNFTTQTRDFSVYNSPSDLKFSVFTRAP